MQPNYPDDITLLPLVMRQQFYVVLLHELTIVQRIIMHDTTFSDKKRIARFYRMNEIVHDVTNDLYELYTNTSSRKELYFHRSIEYHLVYIPDMKDIVYQAVKWSYDSVKRTMAENNNL